MTKLNNEQNILYKKLGLGILNSVIEPVEQSVTSTEFITESIQQMSPEFASADLSSLFNFTELGANIPNQNFVPGSGYRVPCTTALLSGTAEIRVTASGSNSVAAINGLRAEFIPSIESPTSCIGIAKCSTSGDTSFVLSASGANFNSLNRLDENPDMQISLLRDTQQIVINNNNSNKSPGIFEVLVLRDEDIDSETEDDLLE